MKLGVFALRLDAQAAGLWGRGIRWLLVCNENVLKNEQVQQTPGDAEGWNYMKCNQSPVLFANQRMVRRSFPAHTIRKAIHPCCPAGDPPPSASLRFGILSPSFGECGIIKGIGWEGTRALLPEARGRGQALSLLFPET